MNGYRGSTRRESFKLDAWKDFLDEVASDWSLKPQPGLWEVEMERKSFSVRGHKVSPLTGTADMGLSGE